MTAPLPVFNEASTAQDVSSALREQISGKNVLITGTSINGIGFEAARALAPYAKLLIITGYNAKRLKLSEEALKKEFPSADIMPLSLDLSSLASVRKAAAEIHGPLDVLIHNAATMGSYYLTEDDIEIQIATAHFGPFLLTKLLMPMLLLSPAPRVIFVSSQSHAQGLGDSGIDFTKFRTGDEPSVAGNTMILFKRYAEVKTANVLMAIELSRRANGQLKAYSLHPGVIAITPVYKQMGILTDDGKPKENPYINWKSLPQGAATWVHSYASEKALFLRAFGSTIVAAFDPRLDDKPQ